MKPLPTEEGQICRRLKEARQVYEFSRGELARRVRLDLGALARVEQGRVPLRYEVARALWLAMPHLSPLFLCNGTEPIGLGFEFQLPVARDLGFGKEALFSEVIARFAEDLATLTGPPNLQRLPPAWVLAQKSLLAIRQGNIEQEAQNLKNAETRIRRWEQSAEQWQKKMLTATSLKGKTTAMHSELSQLLARIKRLSQAKGSKARLAEALGVPQARVSEWLSGKKEPGGETTLRLLKWVEERER
jgi:transcriptional regulator with XRE-family HTH domain